MAILLPQDSLVLNAYAVLVGQTPGNAAFNEHKAYIATNGEAGYKAALNSVFANYTTAQLATSLLNNLGLSSIFTQADAEAYLAANATNRVGAMMDLAAQLYSYADSNTALLAAKTAYANAVDGSYNYSINTANIAGATLSGTIVSGGQTLTLTIGVDNLVGTNGNDSINGVADGVTSTTVGAGQPVTQTFGGLDVLNGGNGTDTLTLSNDVGTMTLATSVTVGSIENLVLRSAQDDITADVQAWTGLESITVDQRGAADNVRITTKGNATSVTIAAGASAAADDSDTAPAAADSVITIADAGTAATTADKLATVSVTGAKGAVNISSDALANLTLVNSAQLATVTNTTVGHTLNVTVNKQAAGAGVTDADATTVNVTATGANSTAFALTANAATTINLAGDKNLVTTLGAQATNLKINSTGTGTLTVGTTLDDDVTFTGGAGKETITITNANTKATAMGAGDDKVNVSGTTLGTNGTIDGGDGTDTIALSAADAAALSALAPADTYEARISNFEKVGLSQVAAFANNTVNLANLDDINYVVSAGTAAGTGAAEVATVTFNGLLSGQSVTISDGTNTQTVTAAADMSAAQVATAFNSGFAAGSLDNAYTVAVADNVATLTATSVGNKTNVASTVGNSTVIQLGAATTNAGVAPITAVTESAVVTFADIALGQTLIIDGITVTATTGAASAVDIATAFRTGVTSGNAVVSGADGAAWSGAAGASLNQLVFTSATASTNVTDIAITGTAAAPTVVTTNGRAAVAGTTESADVTFTALKSGQSVTVAGRTVTADGADLTAIQVEAAFLGGVNAANAVVGGTLANWTVAENLGGAGDSILTLTSATATTNVTNIDVAGYGVSAAPAATAAGVSVVNGNTTAGGGNLTLTNVANAGTLELTGDNDGSITVTMKDATGTADSLNLKLNGAADLAAGAVTVAGVETIAIVATDSTKDGADATDGLLHNPTAPSTLQLNAAAATTITLSGNHGVDFSGSTLTKVTSLDASGVAANVDTTGLTAAQIVAANGVAGAVTFSTVVDNKDVTIKTGNGNDTIVASSVGTATDSTNSATITTGAGADYVVGGADSDTINTGSESDWVDSSTGADTITLGTGNDTYWLGSSTDSVIAKYNTITDFSANTYGWGTNGAANTTGANQSDATKVTGDVIDLTNVWAAAGVEVLVVTNAADAQTFIQNTADAGANSGIALDSSSNLLYIDLDSNGSIDSVIKLTGVTTITSAAFEI